jgi:formylglycine-generating enzyme required for sulfatase activity
MRPMLLALALTAGGCVLDWSAGWPDAATAEARPPDARPDVRPDRVGERARAPEHDWIDIAPGDFEMGSPVGVPCRLLPDENPRSVRLAHAYQLSRTETTQAQFLALLGYTSLRVTHLDRPISKVTWHEATAYCNALSAREGRPACYVCDGEREKVTCTPEEKFKGERILSCAGYRLPSEAEWEHAYRAASTGPLYLPLDPRLACQGTNAVADTIAWYAANAEGDTHPVATRQANAWGIHDLAGNVREWALDDLSGVDHPSPATWIDPVGGLGSFRALRGGSYLDPADRLRAAARSSIKVAFSATSTGFRCARTIPRLFSGVVHKMLMPTVPNEFALDLDGTGPKNALGTMMAMMTALGLKFQEGLDLDLSKGNLLVLLELHADSHLQGTRAIGQVHLGSDPDGDSSNNFTGSTLAIKGNNPAGLYAKGTILDSTVSLRGKVPFPLPLTLNAPATKVLTLAGARIEAKYTGNVTGIIAGGVTLQDFDTILLPAVGETLTWAIGPTSGLRQGEKDELKKALDLNKDGTITVDEIQANVLWPLIKPDLDLDGDKTPDAYSMAAAFEAVPCQIKR